MHLWLQIPILMSCIFRCQECLWMEGEMQGKQYSSKYMVEQKTKECYLLRGFGLFQHITYIFSLLGFLEEIFLLFDFL